MATVNYTLRIDETDKRTVEQVFNRLGLTLAAGLNIYIKAVARQQRIPFDLALHDGKLVAPTPEPIISPQQAAINFISAIKKINKDGFDSETEESFARWDRGEYKVKFDERLGV